MAQYVSQGAAAEARLGGAETLADRGLIQRQRRWLLPLEIEMQQRVGSLPQLEARLLESQSGARRLSATLMTANARLQQQMQIALRNLKSLRAGRAAVRSEGRRKLIDAQIESEREKLAKLRSAWIEPERIAGLPAMRQAMIQWTNSRNELAATLLWIQDARPALREAYEDLAADRQVSLALKALGPGHQLGSGTDYDARPFLHRLGEYEDLVFTDHLPLYRENGDLRVAALIARTPVTFTWKSSEEPTVLTASVIEAAGLRVPEDAPQRQQRFADGRELTVRQFEIPYLRFGRHVLKDVPAFALPPEGEQYGCLIGPAAFNEHSPRAEPEKMRLVVR